MPDQNIISSVFIRRLAQKPASLFAASAALFLFGIALFNLLTGNIYIARLNYVDATTLIMVAILIFRALTKLHSASDLDTISITLVSTISFLFSYEAIYKWSFYPLPWKMPPPELREFLLQVVVGLTIMSGFAQNFFRLKRANFMILGLFIAVWLFWLAVGFPQLWDGTKVHRAIIDLSLSGNTIYALNRGTKIIWFMFYFCLYGSAPKEMVA